MFIIASVLVVTNSQSLQVQKRGKLVKMKIEKMPSSCVGSKVRYYVTYSYDGKLYDKATRGDFCEKHSVGEFIDMKFLEGSDIILRPEESAVMNSISAVILALIGIGISVSQWRKLKHKT